MGADIMHFGANIRVLILIGTVVDLQREKVINDRIQCLISFQCFFKPHYIYPSVTLCPRPPGDGDGHR